MNIIKRWMRFSVYGTVKKQESEQAGDPCSQFCWGRWHKMMNDWSKNTWNRKSSPTIKYLHYKDNNMTKNNADQRSDDKGITNEHPTGEVPAATPQSISHRWHCQHNMKIVGSFVYKELPDAFFGWSFACCCSFTSHLNEKSYRSHH